MDKGNPETSEALSGDKASTKTLASYLRKPKRLISVL